MQNQTQLNHAFELIKVRRFKDARLVIETFLQANPKVVRARILLIQCLVAQGDKQLASSEITAVLNNTQDIEVVNSLAALCVRTGLNMDSVLYAYSKSLFHPSAAFNWAYYTHKNRQPKEAIQRYEIALGLKPRNPESIHTNIAKIYSEDLVNINAAERHLLEALKLKPNYIPSLFNLANLAEQKGERKRAFELFSRCRELEPNNHFTLARLLDLEAKAQQSHLLQKAQKAAEKSKNIDLHFALGRALEVQKNYAEAWKHYEIANRINADNLPPYRKESIDNSFQFLMQNCTKDWINRTILPNGDQPIFVTGMFRSGTTLLEQMLASHSALDASGERNYLPTSIAQYLRRPDGLTQINQAAALEVIANRYQQESIENFGKVDHLIDKRPDNFLHLGILHKLFPKAKMIVLIRNWKDVALSIYSNRLGQGQNYASSISNIKHYYDCHKQLIDHWQELMPDNIITVHYEELISCPTTKLKNLVKHLNIPYEENMLNFHQRKSVVQTPSVWQVRKPLYTSSNQRWRPFMPYCPEFNQ